jgi:hypothetical protein
VEKISSTLEAIYEEFGVKSRLASRVLGPFIYRAVEKEQERLANGWTYEPPTVYEKNAKALAEEKAGRARIKCRLPEIQWAVCEPGMEQA